MSIFDPPIASGDWNGDGKVDSWDWALESSMITMQVEEERRQDEERRKLQVLSSIADDAIREAEESGLDTIDNDTFDRLAANYGMSVSDFAPGDEDTFEQILRDKGY